MISIILRKNITLSAITTPSLSEMVWLCQTNKFVLSIVYLSLGWHTVLRQGSPRLHPELEVRSSLVAPSTESNDLVSFCPYDWFPSCVFAAQEVVLDVLLEGVTVPHCSFFVSLSHSLVSQ